MKESDATDLLMARHGPVTALRLIGYLWKLDTEGEEWLYAHISRQQLNHVRARFAEAKVPFEPGAIEWPGVIGTVKRLADSNRDLRKRNATRVERARTAGRGTRPA